MRPRHVRELRRKPAAAGEAGMRGAAPPVEEDFDGARREARLDPLVHELIRHAVEIVVNLDVIIDVDATRLPFRQLVARLRQREERDRSSCSKSARRLTPVIFIGRSLMASIRSPMAVFRSARVKNVRCRKTARTQRCAIWTLTSTLGLSVGVATRAGMTTA